MEIKKILLVAIPALVLASCNLNGNKSDASGAFETDETIISSETSGILKQFDIEEGQELKAAQMIGYVDSTQIYLKKKQLETQIQSVLSQRPDIASQVAAMQVQLKTAEKEKQRIANLLKADAATQKQMDDVSSQVEVIKKQIDAQQSALGITSQSISEQTSPLKVQIEQINDQLEKCKIINPINGTVLMKYSQANEMVTPGKPLYKIADLSFLTLRAYITGSQLSQVKLNQVVKVMIDDGEKKFREYEGTIAWISEKSEFTPKTIQTKDERASLVYAVKIRVKNDGFIKIGMYGEVKF